MRVLSSLSETEDWTTLPRYRSTTFASDRIVIYRVCRRERPYLRAYVVPAGCRYRDMGKLKFYDDTANDCMCPLLGTYVPRTGDTLIPPLEFVSWLRLVWTFLLVLACTARASEMAIVFSYVYGIPTSTSHPIFDAHKLTIREK